MSDCITTYTRIRMNPTNPQPEDIQIEDIAHALSLLTRAGGHFPEFYSVAQHSMLCCHEAIARQYSRRVSLACLLHDGSEAYLADITRPVKKYLPQYLQIEQVLQDIIYDKYLGGELTVAEAEQVKSVDDALLYLEFRHFMNEVHSDEIPQIAAEPDFTAKSFKAAEAGFLALFKKLQ